MARFEKPIVVRGARNITLGSLIGTRVSRRTYDDADREGYRSLFGGRFDEDEREFESRFVRPLDDAAIELDRVVNRVMNPDRWRSLIELEDYRAIPPCMELMIVQTPVVRRMLEEGRIDGFGYDPARLPQDDLYGRLSDNYRCRDVLEVMDARGTYHTHAVHRSTDPHITSDQKHMIWETRRNIARHLRETDRDITDIDTLRG